MKLYTKKLQQQNKMLEEYFIKISLKHKDIQLVILKHSLTTSLDECGDTCWCNEIEDILDS